MILELPELSADALHVWSLHLPDFSSEGMEVLHAVLSSKEQAKAARFHRELDRRSSIAARGALRLLLSGYTATPAAKLVFQYSENGKPALAPSDAAAVSFNVSHSGDWVVLAFQRGGQVGVDVEKVQKKRAVLAIAARYFTPAERAQLEGADDPSRLFFQLWVRKEAYVKACGSTLFRELNSCTVPRVGTQDGWYFQGLEIDPHYAAAVVADRAPKQVLLRRLSRNLGKSCFLSAV
jgi:4'-phosphopantetheinyl transferase